MVAEGTRNVYIRVRDMAPEKLKNMEETLRQKFKVIYVTEDILKTLIKRQEQIRKPMLLCLS